MTWSYKENEYMYTINGVCMQLYRWSTQHNSYELYKMMCLTKAKQLYPDIFEKYLNRPNENTAKELEEERLNMKSLYNKLNTWHINRDS